MQNPDQGSRIQADGMRINAQGQRNRHHIRKRASVKAKLLGILILLSPIIAIIWWANS
ncbi:MAG: hypothetical protein HOE43_07955 [Chloroflexi bacterium]|jgi:hypothetical protein|nr:hypothetical protein [Chloroflexota bacterium]